MQSINHLRIIAVLPLPFQFWLSFISFPCLIIVTGTSNAALNRSDESVPPCLVPEFSGKIQVFAVEYYVGCAIVVSGFYYAEIYSIYAHFGES